MSHPILRLLATDPKRVVGLAPGPSSEEPGHIESALVEISGSGDEARARVLRFLRVPLPPGLREAVEQLLDPTHATSAAELSTVHFRLGQAFGEAAAAVAGDLAIDLVGCAGQTVWHQGPWRKTRLDLPATTLQLGEPALIAARTGAVTVADFRAADVAVAGEGAPLPPYADWVLHRRAGRVRALQAISGVSSVTVLSDRLADVVAFDNGPGLLLLDELARRAASEEERGEHEAALLGTAGASDWLSRMCARGAVLPDLLQQLLDDDFLRQPPPKAAGRERWGRGFAEQLAHQHGGAPIDLLATATAFVAEAIAHGYRAFVQPRLPLDEVVVCGAGAGVKPLVERLARLLAPVQVKRLGDDDAGSVAAEAREAVTMALLAVEAVHAWPANVPAATGARRPAVLGKLCLPPM